MYKTQIETVLKLDAHSRQVFTGCYAIDELATTTTTSRQRRWKNSGGGGDGAGRFQRACIINYDESDEPGSHWVAVYNALSSSRRPTHTSWSSSASSSSPEFFDPAGLPPLDDRIKCYLLGPNYTYNPNVLQQVQGNACGFYCVYYILQRSRSVSANDIIEFLSAMTSSRSDYYVKDYIYSQFKPVFN